MRIQSAPNLLLTSNLTSNLVIKIMLKMKVGKLEINYLELQTPSQTSALVSSHGGNHDP